MSEFRLELFAQLLVPDVLVELLTHEDWRDLFAEDLQGIRLVVVSFVEVGERRSFALLSCVVDSFLRAEDVQVVTQFRELEGLLAGLRRRAVDDGSVCTQLGLALDGSDPSRGSFLLLRQSLKLRSGSFGQVWYFVAFARLFVKRIHSIWFTFLRRKILLLERGMNGRFELL